MKFFRVLASLLLAVAYPCLCQESHWETIFGRYVTRVAGPSDFDVIGQHVVIGPKTKIEQSTAVEPEGGGKARHTQTRVDVHDIHVYPGELADVYGELDEGSHTVTVSRIVLYASVVHKVHTVNGYGVIDAVLPLPTLAQSGDRLLRADGYLVLVNSQTSIHFEKPLASVADVGVNVWMNFHGTTRGDGTILADKVDFTQNGVSDREDYLREKVEYDPTTVDQNAKQSGLSRVFLGIDPKKIPPYKDVAMQARVSAVGAKLVPKYQRDLPPADESRIDFRFEVIDSANSHDAMTLPNGIVLVPRQVVERLQNDSQLATVLADSIARALEKQTLRAQTESTTVAAAGLLAGVAGGFLAVEKLRSLREEQSGRVSLWLLQDAGYDLSQAPLAWWLLSSEKGTMAETPIPHRAEYLFGLLGERWQQKQMP
jgi:hypothetical protein